MKEIGERVLERERERDAMIARIRALPTAELERLVPSDDELHRLPENELRRLAGYPPAPPPRRHRFRSKAEAEVWAGVQARMDECEYTEANYEAALAECRRIWAEGGLDEDDWAEVKPEIKAPQICRLGPPPYPEPVPGFDAGTHSALIRVAEMAVKARAAGLETWDALMARWWPWGNPMGPGHPVIYYDGRNDSGAPRPDPDPDPEPVPEPERTDP